MMWDYLVTFSSWAERNSGQIQILIAFGALYLAFVGYKKVLDQIQQSKRQEEIAIDQRGYELKIQSLSLLLAALDRNHATLKKLHGIVEHLEKSKSEYENYEVVNEIDIKECIRTSQNKIKELKEIQILIIALCEETNTKKAIDQKTIKLLYDALLSATKDANDYDLMYQIFMDLKS